jgi:predicted nucleotidyltransferase
MGVEFASGKKEFQDADVIPNLRNALGLEVDLLNPVRINTTRSAWRSIVVVCFF